MGIWETNPFFIGIKSQLMIRNQVPCSTSSFLNHTWCFKYMPFWIKQYHGTNLLRLLVVTSLKVCERVYQIIWCSCTNKKFGLLLRLLIFASLWSSISMDFITNIVPFNSYELFWVVVNGQKQGKINQKSNLHKV